MNRKSVRAALWGIVYFAWLPMSARAQKSAKAPATPASPLVSTTIGAIKPNPELVDQLKGAGFKIEPDLSIVQTPTGIRITKDTLAYVGIAFNKQGVLINLRNDNDPLEKDMIVPEIKALIPFAQASAQSPEQVGKILRRWGVPEVFNGNRLMSPNGEATDYGLFFYEGAARNGGNVSGLSGERVKKALSLIRNAMSQASNYQRADVAAADLNRAWDMLSWPQRAPGETPFALSPGSGNGFIKRIGADEQRIKKLSGAKKTEDQSIVRALSAIAALKKYQASSAYVDHIVPLPREANAKSDLLGAGSKPPHENFLPDLLGILDKINGKPLSADQEKWLIESFPMGETVWRMGAQNLWRRGIDGKGVKVAVIDTGVCRNPDIDGNVVARENLTPDRGKACADHATHVAGIIAALAPKAQIESYRVLSNNGDPALGQSSAAIDQSIMKAIKLAIDSGAQVVNMSLAGGGYPSDPMSREINKYAKEKGIIFVISSGNSGHSGVENPSNASAPSVISAGAVDVNGRPTAYSSYGTVFDPETISFTIKTIFMAPGDNIVSTLPEHGYNSRPYGKMSGTSMAAPMISGTAALLVEQAQKAFGAISPAALSRVVVNALERSSQPISRALLPQNMPPDQPVVLVDPDAAYRALRDEANAAAAKAIARPPS
ncbi:MAG: S8 family peptidase [Elusimicrobiota bacterium]